MNFARREGLEQLICPLMDTAVPDPKSGQPNPMRACLVFVRRMPAADRDTLVELLPDEWDDRVRWIFAECVCDENGVPPSPELLADVFSRFSLQTTERVHRTCCAWNEIPYLAYPDEPNTLDQPA